MSPSTDPASLLRRARRLCRASQRELARRAGVSPTVVARIESGRHANPGVLTMARLIDAAGFQLDIVAGRPSDRRGVAFHPFEKLRDRAGRHLPAHVEVVPNPGYEVSGPIRWWGWRYVWSTSSPGRVPGQIYTPLPGRYYQPTLDPVTGAPAEACTILDWDERRQAFRQMLADDHARARAQYVVRGRDQEGRRVTRIGVFAVQGDVREHVHALEAAGCEALPVRRPSELAVVDGLILPGGESTTMIKLARTFGLLDPLRARIAGGMPVYGSCAGMILLADRVDTGGDQLAETVGGLDVTVRRNAFGRQVDSFEEDVAIHGIDGGPVRAVFIRAPWVQELGPRAAVLASTRAGHVVAVRQGPLLATSFHPEMTGDGRVHAYFCAMVRGEC